MKFSCGYSPNLKRKTKMVFHNIRAQKWFKKYTNWHKFYAWYPVRIEEKHCRWLEYVERKATLHDGFIGDYYTYEYRIKQ